MYLYVREGNRITSVHTNRCWGFTRIKDVVCIPHYSYGLQLEALNIIIELAIPSTFMAIALLFIASGLIAFDELLSVVRYEN